ncbi:MAG: hypothetical protein MGG37_12520 [Trichodesmium sp. MAG_R01]|nr:hypothetical protein [Trichodesmium sp. MAG_R01]
MNGVDLSLVSVINTKFSNLEFLKEVKQDFILRGNLRRWLEGIIEDG